jgi:hypothetical protein
MIPLSLARVAELTGGVPSRVVACLGAETTAA